MKRFTTMLVALLCGLFFLSACSSENKESFRHEIPAAAETGIHVHNIGETSSYLMKDGKTPYQVLVPDSADANTLMARNFPWFPTHHRTSPQENIFPSEIRLC